MCYNAGAMHIEKMLWKMNGSWFQGSGWTTGASTREAIGITLWHNCCQHFT